MTLSQFLQMMKKYIGGGYDNCDFVQHLMFSMMREPTTDEDKKMDKKDQYYPYSTEASRSSAEKLYNGSRNISLKIAQHVYGHLYPITFLEEVNALEDPRDDLLQELQTHGAECNDVDSVGEFCVNIFREILVERMNSEDRCASYEPGADPEDQAMLKNRYGDRLLIETSGYCPNDNCREPLYIWMNKKTDMHYNVARIRPRKTDTYDNLIALCPKCFAKYQLAASSANIKRMQEIKKELLTESEAKSSLADIKLEEGVERVLRKLAAIECPNEADLNYNPVEIYRKILPKNGPLLIKIQGWDSVYYSVVADIFKDVDRECDFRYEDFCCEIRLAYLKLKAQGLSQPDIFEYLSSWLSNLTHEGKDYCSVVIAFFVQKCEVFDAITE